MIEWLTKNLSTILVCIVIAAFVMVVIVISFKKRKNGSGCSGCCTGCINSDRCAGFCDENEPEKAE